MADKDARERLRFLTPSSAKLYCAIFGYSRIRIDAEAAAILGEEAVGIISSLDADGIPNEEAEIIVTGDAQEACDHDIISAVQFAHDLQVASEAPSFIYERMNAEAWANTIARFLEGYQARGWHIIVSLRPSLLRRLDLHCDREGVPRFESLRDAKPCEELPRRSKAFVLCDGQSENACRLYEERKHSSRVERYWLAYFLREWIAELLMEHYAGRLREYGVSLLSANWAWGFDHFLGVACPNPTSADIEMRAAHSKDSISDDPASFESFLSRILCCDPDDAIEKFEGVSIVSPALEVFPGTAKQADIRSPYVNIVDGCRLTDCPPPSKRHTIYLMGGCTFFGYAIEDAGTLASHLQRMLDASSLGEWEVVDLALWGGNFDQCYRRIESLPLMPGDVIVVSHAFGNVLAPHGVECMDLSLSLADERIDEGAYWDRVVHCGTLGYAMIAEGLAAFLHRFLDARQPKDGECATGCVSLWLQDQAHESPSNPTLDRFLAEVSSCAPLSFSEGGRTGAIVMNCNPFTLGHQHLIETASAQVDHLYIFVVEEDKSVFPFADRIELVRKGTAHLENVYVHRSGSFIISSTTFPQYFMKETSNTIDVDASQDLETFGRLIAPGLGISVRFVGEEPFDLVTRRYNEDMKVMLPSYGIELVEIARKKTADEESIISATTVRKLLKENDLESLRRFVPKTTLDYLLEEFSSSHQTD